MKMKKKNIVWMLVFAFTLLCLPYIKTMAASNLYLYDYGIKKNITYTGKQVKYYLDGKEINMSNTPGIIIDGTSLASFRDIFVRSGIKANFEYNATKGEVLLTKNGTTIKFTVGSKTAYVNGKKTTLSVAPMKLKVKSRGYSQVFVPTRFTAETFGYTYVWNSGNSTVSMTSPMNLYYNGNKVAYTGTKGSVSVDGTVINLGKMPSIIMNNTAMVYAYKVFGSAPINAYYRYDEIEGTVTLKKNDVTVILTLGSKIANVNGKSHVMDVAPVMVKNLDTNASHVMVPGSFVASYLGYDYRWDSNLKRSVITTRVESDNNTGIPDGPELGGEEYVPTDTTFFTWNLLSEYADEVNRIGNITNTKEIDSNETFTGSIYEIRKDNVSTDQTETYSIVSTTPFGDVTSTLNNQTLTLHISNAYAYNSSYYFGGTQVSSISVSYNYSDISTDVSLYLNNPNDSYTLSLSEDKCTLNVTFYKNYLSKVTAGMKAGNDYITLTGLGKLGVQLTETGNQIILMIPNTTNGVGTNSFTNETADSLHSLRSVQIVGIDNNWIQVIIEKSQESNFVVTETDTEYTITFNERRPEHTKSTSVVQFKLPENVFFSEITHEDRYYKNEFSIYVPGDQQYLYANTFYGVQDGRIKNISVVYDYNKNITEIIVKTTKLQGYKLVENNGFVDVTIGDPRDIYKNIVVLDAGHGGTDPGAVRKLNGKTINEKDVNFSIIYDYCRRYFDAPDSEIKAYYSRYNDTKVDLYERAAFAKKVGADLFISLHMNANNNTSVRGTEIYYSNENNKMSEMGLNSKELATLFLEYLPNAVGTVKREIRAQKYVVTRENTVPAILVELGFMSNTKDLTLMTKDTFRDDTARAFYDILNMIFDAYPTGR